MSTRITKLSNRIWLVFFALALGAPGAFADDSAPAAHPGDAAHPGNATHPSAAPQSLSEDTLRLYGKMMRIYQQQRNSAACNPGGKFIGTADNVQSLAGGLGDVLAPVYGTVNGAIPQATRFSAVVGRLTDDVLNPQAIPQLDAAAGALHSLPGHGANTITLARDLQGIDGPLAKVAGYAQAMLAGANGWDGNDVKGQACDDQHVAPQCESGARVSARGAAGAILGAVQRAQAQLGQFRQAVACKRAEDEISTIVALSFLRAPEDGVTDILQGGLAKPIAFGEHTCTDLGQVQDSLGAILNLSQDASQALLHDDDGTQYPLYLRRIVVEMTADYVHNARRFGAPNRALSVAERNELNRMIMNVIERYKRFEHYYAATHPNG